MLKFGKSRLPQCWLQVDLWAGRAAPVQLTFASRVKFRRAAAPLANSTVTLWAASSGEPKQLAQQNRTVVVNFRLVATRRPALV